MVLIYIGFSMDDKKRGKANKNLNSDYRIRTTKQGQLLETINI